MGDLTEEGLNRLLEWLDADRDAAALKYEKIRQRIIRFLVSRGCYEAESVVDDTIDRVAAKTEWLIANFVGDPALYFHGVAQRVFKEWLRKKRPLDLPPPDQEASNSEGREQIFECLDECIERLPEGQPRLLFRYHEGEKQVRINNRKRLAEELGITLDALRIRVHRIRKEVGKCVLNCLAEAPAH